ncbi:MAG: xylulokinase [Candidatus Poribacteria bacterium]|nr:xylulokinase [Candidatus Poribacteria bacterium]
MEYALGIDLGTGSTKVVLLDSDGEIVATASADYPLLKPHPGWVEQNPDDWWQALCQTVQAVLREAEIPNTAVRSVALSGQINGAVFVDGRGSPLRPALIWLDHRSQAECDWGNAQAGDLIRSRTLQKLNPVNTLGKVLWVKRHEPEVYAQAHAILMPKDWLVFRLTGVLGAEMSDASASAAFDLFERRWSNEILEKLEVNPELFLPVVESPEVVGQVTTEAGSATGLAAGTRVCGGGGDISCMVLGSGVIEKGIVSVGIGTAGHAVTFADSLSDAAVNQLWPMCHAIPGKYAWLGCTLTGGASLIWFRDSFGMTYEQLNAEAENAPAGAEGLFFMPWLEGTATPYPDAHARGGFLGLTLRHSRGHMVRALMEGVVFDLRHSLECFKSLGLPIEEVRMGEGGSRSALWRQIHADVFCHDLRLIDTEDLSAVGAALIAGVGGGIFPDFPTACKATIKLGEMVRCDPERAAFYEEAYQRYCELYPTLKSWFEKG